MAVTPLNFTEVAPVKLVPVTVTVVPTGPCVGVNEVIVGGLVALVIVKVKAFDAEAPGSTTVTEAVPAVVTSEAWMTAVTCVEDTNVVVLAEPFQSTTAPDTKPVPATVKVNAALPARAEDGERLVRCAAVPPCVSVKLAVSTWLPLLS